MDKIVVWHNQKKDTYYYKIVSGYYRDYRVGESNQYNHIIVLVDDFYKPSYRVSIKKRLIRRLIRFLEKL